MSLKAAAHHLASRGRGEDSLLVHMTPGEVHGLQALAKAHGGSLTQNPDTGLPEAGFLKNILPTLIGVGAAMTGVGLPFAAALGAGAGALTNKENPLMGAIAGGLGAYGGASLGAGLTEAGASAAANAVPAGATQAPFTLAGPTQIMSSVPSAGTAFPTPDLIPSEAAQAAAGSSSGFSTPNLIPSEAAQAAAGPSAAQTASDTVAREAAKNAYYQQPGMDRFTQGLNASAQNPSSFMQGMGGGSGLVKSAAMAAAPVIMAPPEPFKMPDEANSAGYRYSYDPGYTGGEYEPRSAYSSEKRYFRPKYTQLAQGGIVNLAAGGAFDPASAYDRIRQANPGRLPDSFQQFSAANTPAAPVQLPAQSPIQAPVQTAAAPMAGPYTSGPAQGMSGASANAINYLSGMTSASQPTARQGVMPLPRVLQDTPEMRAPNPAAGMSGPSANAMNFLMGRTNQSRLQPPSAPALTLEQMTAPWRAAEATRVAQEAQAAQAAAEAQSRAAEDYQNRPTGEGAKAGGELRTGGFVVPADVVSALGNGSTDAGLEALMQKFKATPIDGPGDGMSDSISTTIEGKQKARVARGEAYLTPEQVQQAGGTKKLYAMLDRIRQNAHGKTTQQRQVNPNKAMG